MAYPGSAPPGWSGLGQPGGMPPPQAGPGLGAVVSGAISNIEEYVQGHSSHDVAYPRLTELIRGPDNKSGVMLVPCMMVMSSLEESPTFSHMSAVSFNPALSSWSSLLTRPFSMGSQHALFCLFPFSDYL